ncbi:hypothetical protein GCM10010471_10120 [Leucobacter komagatae]
MPLNAVELQRLLAQRGLATGGDVVDEGAHPLDSDIRAERGAGHQGKKVATGELAAAEIGGSHHASILPSAEATRAPAPGWDNGRDGNTADH